MAGFIRLTNPIWWIQVHLLGGWRRILGFGCAYPAIMLACTLAYRRMERQASMASLCSDLLYALSILQAAIILVGGCTAISRAIARDMQTQMIESHRLSAMDALGTMWGYLLGPTLTVLLVWGMGVLYGVVLCARGGLAAGDWLAGSGLLLLSCLCVWSLVVFAGIAAQKRTNVGAAIIGAVLLGQYWVVFIPGAGLFLGIYPVLTSYWLTQGRSRAFGAGISIMVFTCVAMLFIWIMAAARKYRHPQQCSFSSIAALGLLVVWLVVTVLGIHHFDSLGVASPTTQGWGQVHFITALLATLLIGIIPLHSLALTEIRRIRSGVSGTWKDRAWPIVFPMAVVLLICGILGIRDIPNFVIDGRVCPTNLRDAGIARWWPTALALLFGLLAIGGLLRRAYATRKTALFLCSLFIVFVWAGPIVGDAIWANWKRETSNLYNAGIPLSWIFGSSPPGTVVVAWVNLAITPWPGLAVQAIIAAILQVLGYRAMGRERRHRLASDS